MSVRAISVAVDTCSACTCRRAAAATPDTRLRMESSSMGRYPPVVMSSRCFGPGSGWRASSQAKPRS